MVTTGVAGSYQAFAKLLNRWTAPLLEAITLAFRQTIQAPFAVYWLVEDSAMFGVVGSKIALPRTANLPASCAASRNRIQAAQFCRGTAARFQTEIAGAWGGIHVATGSPTIARQLIS